jgi:hypothetical protein
MNFSKVDSAVQRLEQILPIRQKQTRLAEPLRQLHQKILRYYLEHGSAPQAADLGNPDDWQDAIVRLAADGIIVLNDSGDIAGAYPFSSEERDFRVTTQYGTVQAMCAFDALAVSSMFAVPTRIDAHCRLSARDIRIEQEGGDIRLCEPDEPVLAAIDWNAGAEAGSCSATLCCEMFFAAGERPAQEWRDESPANRELFDLDEAHAMITTVFAPLVR